MSKPPPNNQCYGYSKTIRSFETFSKKKFLTCRYAIISIGYLIQVMAVDAACLQVCSSYIYSTCSSAFRTTQVILYRLVIQANIMAFVRMPTAANIEPFTEYEMYVLRVFVCV